MDIRQAYNIAVADYTWADPRSEAEAISTLFNAGTAAGTGKEIEGFSGWQLHHAAKNIIDRQDHSIMLEAITHAIDQAVSGHQQEDIATSPLLRGIGSWQNLDSRTRIKFCGHVADYMANVMNACLPLAQPMHFFTLKHRQSPLSHFNQATGRRDPYVLPVRIRYDDDYVYDVSINTHPQASFDDPVKLVGGIYEAALKTWQYQLARERMLFHPEVPAHLQDIKTDVERLFSLQTVDKQSIEKVYGRGIFVESRFAKKHADIVTQNLEKSVAAHGKDIVPVEPKKGLVRYLGL